MMLLQLYSDHSQKKRFRKVFNMVYGTYWKRLLLKMQSPESGIAAHIWNMFSF